MAEAEMKWKRGVYDGRVDVFNRLIYRCRVGGQVGVVLCRKRWAVDLAYRERCRAVTDCEMFLFNPAMILINFLPKVL